MLRCLRGSNKKRLRSQGKSSKRVAKQLLKEPDNRSALALWREYAHMEWALGNLDEARKVFSTATAIGGAAGLRSATLCELCLLWAQLEVEHQENPGGGLSDATGSPAVAILTRLAEGASSSTPQAPSPVAILKARKSYDQALTAALSALDQSLHQADKQGSHHDCVITKFIPCEEPPLLIISSVPASSSSGGPAEAAGPGRLLRPVPVPDHRRPGGRRRVLQNQGEAGGAPPHVHARLLSARTQTGGRVRGPGRAAGGAAEVPQRRGRVLPGHAEEHADLRPVHLAGLRPPLEPVPPGEPSHLLLTLLYCSSASQHVTRSVF